MATKSINALRSTESVAPMSCSSFMGLLGRRLSMRAESNSRQIRCAFLTSGSWRNRISLSKSQGSLISRRLRSNWRKLRKPKNCSIDIFNAGFDEVDLDHGHGRLAVLFQIDAAKLGN